LQAPRWVRRAVFGGVSVITATVGFSGLGATAAHATSSFKFTNEFGADRYATAANNNATAFPAGVNTVVLADAIPGHQSDALAASGYAGINGYGILLTDNTNTVPAPTMSALSSLKVKNVIALGGSAAVSPAQISQLTAAGYTVTQPFQGANGYATMQAIDSSITPSSVGTSSGGLKTAILASGDSAHLIDATASSGLAYGMKFPVITTESSSATLGPEAQAVVSKLGIQKLIPVGGSAAIPTTQYSPAPTGITNVDNSATTGADRSATSVALANDASSNYGFDSPLTNMILATGATFVGSTTTTQNDGADALSSGPLGGVTKSVTILTVSPTDPGQAVNFAKAHSSTLDPGYLDSGQLSTSGVAQQVQTAAQGGTGGSGNTSLPQLLSAAILQTVTAAQATPPGTLPGPAGTYVGYTFSQPVAGTTIVAAGFKVFDASDNEYTAAAAAPLGSSAPNTVVGYFPEACAVNNSAGVAVGACGAGSPGSNLATTTGAANLTLATVAGPDSAGGPALTAPSGKAPDGSASIGTASSTGAAAAGVTTAPNPESWAITNTSGANPVSYPNGTPVNVTFDKTAFTQNALGAFPVSGTVTSTGFSIVLVSTGTQVNCFGPPNTDTTTAGSGTVAGGNGTSTITIVCPDTTAGTPITAAQIARVVVAKGTVGTTAVGGAGDVTNPLESADTPHVTSASPDLTGVAFIPGSTSTTNDTIVFTYDQAIQAGPVANDFAYYLSNGTEVDCGALGGPVCTANVNPSNFDQVAVTVQAGAGAASGATLGATGAISKAGAVTGANAPNKVSVDDELGGTNPNNPASTITPGTVNGPQLTTTHVTSTTNALGTVVTATYTFTEAVAAGAHVPGGLHLYDPDGTELTCTAATIPAAPNNNVVVCTAFVQAGGATPATNTQLTSAALGTADYNTVVGNATTPTGATNPGAGNVNPEGGVATS